MQMKFLAPIKKLQSVKFEICSLNPLTSTEKFEHQSICFYKLIIVCSYWSTCGSVKIEKGSSLYSRYNLHMHWTVKVSRQKDNLVTEYCYRVPVGFDFLFYSSKVDLEKVVWQWMYDREGIFCVCSNYELYFESVYV